MNSISLWFSSISAFPLLRNAAIFIFSYLEGLPVIGTFVPGGTIAILVGALSSQGELLPIVAVLLTGVGSFLGDMTGFLIGKRYKHWRWVKKLINTEKHQNSWDMFDRHLALIVIFGRLVPVVRSAPAFLAGARDVRTYRYVVLSFIGSVVWACAGIYGGNLLGRAFGESAVVIILAIFVTVALIGLGIKLLKKKKTTA